MNLHVHVFVFSNIQNINISLEWESLILVDYTMPL